MEFCDSFYSTQLLTQLEISKQLILFFIGSQNGSTTDFFVWFPPKYQLSLVFHWIWDQIFSSAHSVVEKIWFQMHWNAELSWYFVGNQTKKSVVDPFWEAMKNKINCFKISNWVKLDAVQNSTPEHWIYLQKNDERINSINNWKW